MLTKICLLCTEIRQMMHGFGDSSEPLFESAKIIEEVVLQQMRAIIRKASEIADRRASSRKSNVLNGEDLLFLLRRDKVKLRRIIKYLGKYALKLFNCKHIVYCYYIYFFQNNFFRNQRNRMFSSQDFRE